MKFTVIIPARYGSSRFPGKPLAIIDDRPMVQWVYQQAQASGAERVIVATDDQRIYDAVKQFGGDVCMTSTRHSSGTERLNEVCQLRGLAADEIVVNVQGDEPLIPPENIREVAESLQTHPAAQVATLAAPLQRTDEWLDPNVVKVVTDQQGMALYFSRAAIPHDRDGLLEQQPKLKAQCWRRHIGLYGYRAGFIADYVQWAPSLLEQLESLEQLRVLWYGGKIHVENAPVAHVPGVDTPENLQAVRNIVAERHQH